MPDLDRLGVVSEGHSWGSVIPHTLTVKDWREKATAIFFVKYFFLLLDWMFVLMSVFVLNKC